MNAVAKSTPRKRAASKAAKREWDLICVTRLGKVSMLRDLDLLTARETYKRLMPGEHPEQWVWHKCLETGKEVTGCSGWGRSYGPHDDWLERVDAIGPEGAKLDPWHGVKPHIKNFYCECGCRFRQHAEAAAVEASLSVEEKEERRLRDLFKQVPSAFWLAPREGAPA